MSRMSEVQSYFLPALYWVFYPLAPETCEEGASLHRVGISVPGWLVGLEDSQVHISQKYALFINPQFVSALMHVTGLICFYQKNIENKGFALMQISGKIKNDKRVYAHTSTGIRRTGENAKDSLHLMQ